MIKIRNARMSLGWLILIAQMVSIALFLFYAPTRGFTFMQGLVGAATIAPVTGAYVSLFVRYVSLPATPVDENGQLERWLRPGDFYVKVFVVGAFALALSFGIYFFVNDNNQTEEAAQVFSGAIQTIFGGYLTRIYGTLFPKEVLGVAED